MKTLKYVLFGFIISIAFSFNPIKKHQKVSGNILISSSIGALEPIDSLRFIVQGSVRDKKNINTLDLGNLAIGGTNVVPNNKWYSSNFTANYSGKTVTVSLMNKENTEEEFSVAMYFPLAITSADVNMPKKFKVGSTITWNADSNNHKGVVLIIEYNHDQLYVKEGETKKITVPIDAGTYTFTENDLSDMNNSQSENNYCLISILRGDSYIVSNTSDAKIKSRVQYLFSSPWFMAQSN